MKIIIKTFTSNHVLDISPDNTVKDIKLKMKDIGNFPIEMQQIKLGDQLLLSRKKLSDYDIKDGSELFMLLNLPMQSIMCPRSIYSIKVKEGEDMTKLGGLVLQVRYPSKENPDILAEGFIPLGYGKHDLLSKEIQDQLNKLCKEVNGCTFHNCKWRLEGSSEDDDNIETKWDTVSDKDIKLSHLDFNKWITLMIETEKL